MQRSPLGGVLIDRRGRIVAVNPALEQMCGRKEAALLKARIETLILKEDREEFRRSWRQLVKGQRENLRTEGRWLWKGGLGWVRCNLWAGARGRGLHWSYLGILEDISLHKRTEEAMHQLSGRLLRLQDEERRRIARELHDITAQRLTALVMNVARVQRSLPGSQDVVKRLLGEGEVLAEECLRDIRTLTYVLHPPLLEERGLAPAIKWYVHGFSKRSNIRVSLKVPAKLGRLPDDVELALFRVVQESLQNIHLHSGSESGRVALRRVARGVELKIEDEGRGISPGTLENVTSGVAGLGVGIAGMRERIRQLGGQLEIWSGGSGTTVRVRIPWGGSPQIMEVTILVADDHEVVRAGVRAILESHPGWKVWGEPANGREAVEKARALAPRVVVMDIAMPMLDGLEATRQIQLASPQTDVLILTVHDSEETLQEVLKAGARGYVVKADVAKSLVAAVESLVRHQSYFSSEASATVMEKYFRGVPRDGAGTQPGSRLTPREREIMQLIVEGRADKEIADILGVSGKTVETHRANIMRKLQLHSSVELVRYAIRNKMVHL